MPLLSQCWLCICYIHHTDIGCALCVLCVSAGCVFVATFTLVFVVHCVCLSVTEENSQKQTDDLGTQFTDVLIKEAENVTLLLSLLEVSLIFPSVEMQACYWAFTL